MAKLQCLYFFVTMGMILQNKDALSGNYENKFVECNCSEVSLTTAFLDPHPSLVLCSP